VHCWSGVDSGIVYVTAACRFLKLWTEHVNKSSSSSDSNGAMGAARDLTPACVVGPDAPNGSKALQACQQEYMHALFADVISFAGGGSVAGSMKERVPTARGVDVSQGQRNPAWCTV
jgi:hypothetical protein